MKRLIAAALRCSLVFLVPAAAYAISAQWDLDPISGDWNTAANWTPNGVPDGRADIAIFGLSHTIDVSISEDTEVNGIIFTLAATNPYTITASPRLTLTISGVGIVNISGTTQHFVTAGNTAGNAGPFTAAPYPTHRASQPLPHFPGLPSTAIIKFMNSATAGNGTAFTNKGSNSDLTNGGSVEFLNSSTAGHATFTNEGGVSGGFTLFNDTSTAANGVFNNNGGSTFFFGRATAENATLINNNAGDTRFFGSSTAGNATITNTGVTPSTPGGGGNTFFSFTSTAGNATINNNGSTAGGQFGEVGNTDFQSNSSAGSAIINNNSGTFGGFTVFDGTFSRDFGPPTAGNATINNNGATVAGERGGVTRFVSLLFFPGHAAPTAGDATINNNGGTVSGAGGGKTIFDNISTAGNSTLIANGGINGGERGAILFEGRSTGGMSRVEVFGNGSLDISGHLGNQGNLGLVVGSIEGDGNVFLGAQNLVVGTNDLHTAFSGVIQDGGLFGGTGGSLLKVGTGTLIVSGANTYTGSTDIWGGVLQVDSSINTNATMHGSGTLAGTGIVHGSVISHGWGKVSPGQASGVPGVLTVVHDLTQTQYATMMIQIAGTNTGQFSILDVLGTANLNGYLDPVLLNGFVPNIGQSFTFLNYASFTGEFSQILNQVFNHGTEQWDVVYQPNEAILTVGPNTIPDQGSTLLLLTLGLLGLLTYRRQSLRRQSRVSRA